MAYTISTTNQFDKHLKKCLKRGLAVEDFKTVVRLLAETGKLPVKYRPHKLTGDYNGCWECHIKPDWLLVWEIYEDELRLLLIDTGSHADLFG